ncbi:hypothetical protein MKZ27_19585 [Bacillus sp. FSL R5-0394]
MVVFIHRKIEPVFNWVVGVFRLRNLIVHGVPRLKAWEWPRTRMAIGGLLSMQSPWPPILEEPRAGKLVRLAVNAVSTIAVGP